MGGEFPEGEFFWGPLLLEIKKNSWAAANGGVTNGGLRGVWLPFLEIGRTRPFSAFCALFRRVRKAPGKSRKRRKKALILRYPQICLNPHLLNPHLRHSNLLLGMIGVFGVSGIFLFCWGVLGPRGSGGPVGVFETI